MMLRAVFLDRDGVINPLVPREQNGQTGTTSPWFSYEYAIYENVKEACQILKKLNFLRIVVTNQPEVHNGIFDVNALHNFHRKLIREDYVDITRYCTDKDDPGYKPGHANVMQYIKSYNIDASQSYMIGDRWKDIVCGYFSGLQTIRVGNVKWEMPDFFRFIKPTYRCASLYDAAQLIQKNTCATKI